MQTGLFVLIALVVLFYSIAKISKSIGNEKD